jgi:GT2 family glycosyltransferase
VPLVDPAASKVTLRLLPAPFPGGVQPTIRFHIGDKPVAEVTVPDADPIDLTLAFESDGTVVGGEPFSDVDGGRLDAIEDVPALCGAACLLRRRALEQTGPFDESFFMSYEDADLSFRLRTAGWRIVIAPRSIVRHQHRATGDEWSPRLPYDAERNRLLMLMKNEELPLAAREWARYTARLFRPGETVGDRKRFLHLQGSLLRQLPSVISARRRARARSRRPSLL